VSQLLISLAIVPASAGHPSWFPDPFYKCHNGKHQSPIDIVTSNVRTDDAGTFVTLVNYNTLIPVRSNVSEEFYGTVIIYEDNVPPDVLATITRNCRSTQTYKLHSLHFRWHCSEHAVDDRHYALEAQFIHFNRKYANISAAMTKRDGILAVAVLFGLDHRDNEAIDGVLDVVNKNASSVHWSHLLPLNGSASGASPENFELYHYSGSLTLKPCAETVAWFVVPGVNYVSEAQIERFQSLFLPSLANNCRPTQPVNERLVRLVRGGLRNRASTRNRNLAFVTFSLLYLSISTVQLIQILIS
jgi:carbonic anhydrase